MSNKNPEEEFTDNIMDAWEESVMDAFEEGFTKGFIEGKTRNIVTEKYFEGKLKQALENFKKEWAK